MQRFHTPRLLTTTAVFAALTAGLSLQAAPKVSRLTPPSGLFSFQDSNPPIISRFLPGQRFDLQATLQPDAGNTFTKVEFLVDGVLVPGTVSQTPATVSGLPAGTSVATLRAYANSQAGVHILTVRATQSDGATVSAEGNFEVHNLGGELAGAAKAKKLIFLIGDGMGIAHRTAARIMLNGVSQGKALAPLSMDRFPVTGLVSTSSLNSIVTDSAPGASCYSTGNKNNNNQEGVFPDDTTDKFDNPRMEYVGEYLARTQGKSLGIVTTSDVFDATPAAFAVHTQDRGAGTGICDQYLDESVKAADLRVLMGGGRKWFLPSTTAGSARADASDYVLPDELATAWGVAKGAKDKDRDLISDFQKAGFSYAANASQLKAVPAGTDRLLGLFALSNMNVALDKINGRRGVSTVVNDYGFPDQPMLDEMADKALEVLSRNSNGFVLMIEASSIDKQAHNMDTDRWILETIEFDRAIERVRQYIIQNPDTLAVVTADHECAGVNIIGASTVTQAKLAERAAGGGGAAQLRDATVGVYEAAGFPVYKILDDGYPESTNPDRKLLIGYAANADRYENWQTYEKPLQDSQQPFVKAAPLNTYPADPTKRAVAGGFMVTGQVPGTSAVHTASDIPLSAMGAGASLFTGVMDNTQVFFKAMEAVHTGVVSNQPSSPVGQRTAADRLVNMSTRGFVGTGNQALICGFIVTGTQPKTLVVRAVGPTLAQYNVPGYLENPTVRIFSSSGAVLAGNDDWELSTNLLSLKAATKSVGAFDLKAGSHDAAMLVTLPPGTYSAIATGTDNSTGIALLEVYETP